MSLLPDADHEVECGPGSMRNDPIKGHEAFIWLVADLLRGDYKQSENGRVIMPLAVLRWLDCVLEPTNPCLPLKLM